MAIQKYSKLNRLQKHLPEGLLADAAWFEQNGYSRSLRNQYVRAGWLEQSARGVFRRPRGQISWEQVAISLQTLLGYPVSIGGRSALELQGYAHYLHQSRQDIHLYCDKKLPSWLHKLPLQEAFIVHNRLRLWTKNTSSFQGQISLETPPKEGATLSSDLRVLYWGQWHWPMIVSCAERAYLELLDELPKNDTFHTADVMMEGLVNISPRRMQSLLEATKSVKVKRLFFFFADRHQHQWLAHIQRQGIDMGAGKRVLVEGGKLDPTYHITVPPEFLKEKHDHDDL
jgi:hypothetical protein